MDVKDEDKSEESRKNHMVYYRSLINTIKEIKEEKHMEKDQKRLREMFPDITEEEWNGNTK